MDYITIKEPVSASYIEKRSRFIADIAPASGEEDAQLFIESVKGRYKDARHHVYAYILNGGNRRFSDDGEPQGTAGIPVLEVLQRKNLCAVVAVVTRYFGGILLGAPGLVRAYSHAVSLAADSAQQVMMQKCHVYQLRLEYNQLAQIEKLIAGCGGYINQSEYGVNVEISAVLPMTNGDRFINELTGLTSGSVVPVSKGTVFSSCLFNK